MYPVTANTLTTDTPRLMPQVIEPMMGQPACRQLPSPAGVLRLVADSTAIIGVDWWDDARHGAAEPASTHEASVGTERSQQHTLLARAAKEFAEFWRGERRHFSVPIKFTKGTEFQRRVWSALLTIPFGETRSYSELAVALGLPRAVRAVGAANAANPIAIIVPCHRVIGKNGRLTGFAGGLPAKARLLRHENHRR